MTKKHELCPRCHKRVYASKSAGGWYLCCAECGFSIDTYGKNAYHKTRKLAWKFWDRRVSEEKEKIK